MNSKWTKFGVIAVALLVGLMVMATVVSAQGPGNGAGTAFVDANNDGVCDNYSANSGLNYGGRGNGQGTGFVDANNDGVCDNCGANSGPQSNTPRGQRGGRR